MGRPSKLAVVGSGNGSNFEAIAKRVKADITCISDIKNAYILERARNLGVKAEHVTDNIKYFSENKFDLIALAGYMQILPPEVLELGRFVNIHPSLLPAFKGKDAIKRAFLAGVKVSGVTIHWVENELDSGKIIAQYPVLIGNLMHFDEFETEIHRVEHALYPVVIEKLLNDEVFDFSDLMGGGKCGGCKCG
jgi:phosphoribosylglycinamide formyltransferase-1